MDKNNGKLTTDPQALQARAQFVAMIEWAHLGWQPAPAGRRCPCCAGKVWLRDYGRTEMHRCSSCAWQQQYGVG